MNLRPEMKSVLPADSPASPQSWADKGVEIFLQQGLFWLLIALFLLTGLPFVAPVAMAMGWTSLGEWLYFVFAPFCHQLPQRSWFLFGEQWTYSLEEIYRV